MTVPAVLGWALVAGWAVSALFAVRALRTVPILARLAPPEPAAWPRVSVLVPARDEADSLGPVLAKLAAADYPALEIVVVNDRSRDRTGEVAEAAAARDPRIRVLHVTERRAGWLGKLAALDRAVALAGGEWLLFLDADIHMEPGALKKAVALAESRQLDHFSLLPVMWPTTFLVDAGLGSLLRGFLPIVGNLKAVEDPGSGLALGVGAFQLVRRSALDRSPGLAHLRLAVADDVALAQMLKASGARSSFARGQGLLGLHYYPTFRQMAHGTERLPGLTGGRLGELALFGLFIFAGEVLPFALLAVPAARLPAAMACGLALVASTLCARFASRPLLPTLFVPLGGALGIALLVRSVILALSRGGLTWRDDVYPLALLRTGARAAFFPGRPRGV